MPKAKDILKDVGLAAAALAGIQALRNDKFRRDFRKIGEEELEPLRKAVKKENARENVPTFPKARMVDVLPKLSKEEIAENFFDGFQRQARYFRHRRCCSPRNPLI